MILLPDPALARGNEPALSFSAHGATELAQQLQNALTSDQLFQTWRNMQDEPENIDPALGVTDAKATVSGVQDDLSIRLTVVCDLDSGILKQRLRWLAGRHWQLRDVTAVD